MAPKEAKHKSEIAGMCMKELQQYAIEASIGANENERKLKEKETALLGLKQKRGKLRAECTSLRKNIHSGKLNIALEKAKLSFLLYKNSLG